MNLYPVIMAGGSGTRFWPLSRKSRPKQFLPLGTDLPLITDTAKRLAGLAKLKDTFVVCGKVHAGPTAKLVKGLPRANILVEPSARNTAPAIALAVAHVSARDPEGVLAVLPSDHHVANVKGFKETLATAADVANDHFIVTVGIKPSRPETGYGYVQRGEDRKDGSFSVKKFAEKPDLEKAKAYLASGDFLWNGGIFVFRADTMKAAFKEHMPALFTALEKIEKAVGTRNYAKVLAREFPKMEATSIDYGIAEKAKNIAVVPGDFGWSDVGSFAAVSEVKPTDARGNVTQGKNALVIDSDGSVVISHKRLLAVVGVKDLVVVDAGDAILVVPKDKAQDVRKIVEALKAKKLDKLL